MISAGWLVAGWTLGGLGATYLIKAVEMGLGLLLALLAAGTLLVRWLTRRAGRLPATARRLTLLAAVGFGAAGLMLLVAPATALGNQPEPLFGFEPGPGIHQVTLAAGVALLIAIAALVRHHVDGRQAQHRRYT